MAYFSENIQSENTAVIALSVMAYANKEIVNRLFCNCVLSTLALSQIQFSPLLL